MSRCINLYIAVAIWIFGMNLIRYLRCKYLLSTYLYNLESNRADKNYNISNSAFLLFGKANIYPSSKLPLEAMASTWYKDEITNVFKYSVGIFRYEMLHSFFWVFHVVDKLKMFALVRKIPNKILAFIVAIIQMFGGYLVGLYLDTTGNGSKILNYVLDQAAFLFELLRNRFLG